MDYCKSNSAWCWRAGMIVLAATLMINSSRCQAQDTPAATKSADKTTTAEKASADTAPAKSNENASAPANDKTTPAVGKEKNEAPAEPASTGEATAVPPERIRDATAAAETKNASDSPLPAGKSAPSAATEAAKAAGVNPDRSGWSPWIICVVLLALFVVPIMIGNYLARIWKMPDHGWKISLTLGLLAGAILICLFGQFKYGPDLAGGITLIYELQDAPHAVAEKNGQPANQQNGNAQIKSGGREFSMSELIGSLKHRLDPDGTKEISIREYGPAVEIIIPQVGQDEMDFVKQKITALGKLEFRILADPTIQKDKNTIDLAKRLPPTEKDVKLGDAMVAKWVPYDVKEFGPPERENDGFVKRLAGDTPEILVLMDPLNVTGEYITHAAKGMDDHGGPAVEFAFNDAGSQRFEKLTSQNLPNPATPEKYRKLGILLDNKLVNAPNLHSTISSRGQISGGSMTDREVELNVEVLNAGSLPAALNKTPISQEIISPTLGGQTIDQGKRAIIASLIGVIAFMIFYYRFAGCIACIALAMNLVLVLALMVLIKAAFTLPGLAGLALTVGMSVDTNVLIYERIREELANGAALRMAIRNGFHHAMTAIVDTHVTTLISGIVLFYVGTDQVRGFAVTLILGVVCNLFTAFFCTRVMFDIAERLGMIKQLKMMHIFSHPNFDFLRLRWIFLGASWTLIAIGMVAVYERGSQLLDIDFTGGSSVTFTLNDKDKMSLAEVRDALVKTELADKNLLVVELGSSGTGYTVDTSEQSVDTVKEIIIKEFGQKLKKYSLAVSDIKPVTEAGVGGTQAKILVNAGHEYEGEQGMSYDALHDQILATLVQQGHPNAKVTLENPNYHTGSSVRFSDWTAKIIGVDEAATHAAFDKMQSDLESKPLFPLASTIGGRVSGNMQIQAFLAVGISLVAMIIYLWLRFQKPTYGIAAGVALIHDVLMTVGMIALSYYIVNAFPSFAEALKIDAFQINLTIVAALLTIIGYSVNDTVVTFDRLREIKGKTPLLTAKMVNDSVNQTLGRTILTVFTVFIVVVVLYFYGGAGLHSFAFAFLIGVVVGTYSSIYVASPVLLWLSGVSAASIPEAPPAASTRGMQPAR
jgi:SecD/SecF fusion protein